MQIPGAAVIPQPLPGPEDLFFRRLGQILQGRKLLHPAAKIVFHGFRAGLLEHDFGNPDMVWIAGMAFPPGQFPPVGIEPAEQQPGPVILRNQDGPPGTENG